MPRLRTHSPGGDLLPIAPHLRAVGLAVSAAFLLMVLVRVEGQRELRTRLESFAAQIAALRMNGNLLQRAAFSDPDVLPVYGSSELDQPAGNRADEFFRHRPTGFSVFAEGHAGTTCLMILQKIAAVGSAARGKQAAIFLSPSWFARPDVAAHTISANLPAAQVSAWLFDSPLDHALKQKLARRLLRYPDTTKDQPLLTTAMRSLAGQTWRDRLLFAGLRPFGEMQYQISVGLEAATLLWDVGRYPRRFPRQTARGGGSTAKTPTAPGLNWSRLAAEAESRDRARNDGTVYSVTSRDVFGPHRDGKLHPVRPGERDAEFKGKLRSAEEWRDLKLMTEVLRNLGVHALFIGQPINGRFYDLGGISSSARQSYYRKLDHLLRSTGFPLRDYAEQENDRFFFNDSGHPSAKAWVYYDRQLDLFRRGQLP